jgi:hypothetical protein
MKMNKNTFRFQPFGFRNRLNTKCKKMKNKNYEKAIEINDYCYLMYRDNFNLYELQKI